MAQFCGINNKRLSIVLYLQSGCTDQAPRNRANVAPRRWCGCSPRFCSIYEPRARMLNATTRRPCLPHHTASFCSWWQEILGPHSPHTSTHTHIYIKCAHYSLSARVFNRRAKLEIVGLVQPVTTHTDNTEAPMWCNPRRSTLYNIIMCRSIAHGILTTPLTLVNGDFNVACASYNM